MNWQPKCDLCGRFHKCEPGSAWKMIYSGGRTRCKRCVEKHGAFPVTYCDERSKQP